MKSTEIDEQGDVRCPNCGAKNSFTSKRTGKAKLLGVATIGVGTVAMPKRLKCNGCGANLKRGGGSTSVPAVVRAPHPNAIAARRERRETSPGPTPADEIAVGFALTNYKNAEGDQARLAAADDLAAAADNLLRSRTAS